MRIIEHLCHVDGAWVTRGRRVGAPWTDRGWHVDAPTFATCALLVSSLIPSIEFGETSRMKGNSDERAIEAARAVLPVPATPAASTDRARGTPRVGLEVRRGAGLRGVPSSRMVSSDVRSEERIWASSVEHVAYAATLDPSAMGNRRMLNGSTGVQWLACSCGRAPPYARTPPRAHLRGHIALIP